MTRPIWIACGEKPAIYERRQSPIVVQKHQQGPQTPPMVLYINHWLLKTPFFARRPKHHPQPTANPPKTGHRRARHQFTFRHTPQDARSPRRTKCAARASCMSEDVPKSKLMAGPDDYRAIDYPVFCNPAETPVTVERIRLMYSAFFSSAISSWFIRTSRRARTWAMDRAST